MSIKTIKIDAVGNNMTIDGKNVMNMEQLFTNLNNELNPSILRGITSFQELNREINRGDCNKDGTDLGLLELLFGNFANSFNKDKVKYLANNTISYYKDTGRIQTHKFTKDKRGDESVKALYDGLQFDIGFDSGLGLDNYLADDQYNIVDTFGKYIDPSPSRASNIAFPLQGISISISQKMFELIGYNNCVINSAVYNSHDNYKYDIQLHADGGSRYTKNDSISRDKDPNIQQIFIGNNKKKEIEFITLKDKIRKKSSIIGKSLGDKLQVFIMFIKQIKDEKSRNTNCISTCDEIVMLFCIILGLPCFYTHTERNKENIKVSEVLFFNSNNNDESKIAIVLNRFEKQKEIVLKGYADMIALIQDIKNNNREIIITGHYQKFRFTPEFYDFILEDLRLIIADINNITVDNTIPDEKNILEINEQIKNLKKMTINNFFRTNTNSDTYILAQSAFRYTHYTPNNIDNAVINPYNKGNLLANIPGNPRKTITFFEIAKQYFTIQSTLRGGHKKHGNKNKIMKGGVINETTQEILKNFFYNDKIKVFVKVDEIEKPFKLFEQNGEVFFDANNALLDDLIEIYKTLNIQHIPFEDIYSEMLCLFNYDSDYAYMNLYNNMEKLKKLFDDKIQTSVKMPKMPKSLKKTGKINMFRTNSLLKLHEMPNSRTNSKFGLNNKTRKNSHKISKYMKELLYSIKSTKPKLPREREVNQVSMGILP